MMNTLTPNLAEEAHGYREAALRYRSDATTAWLKLGAALWHLHEKDRWRTLGFKAWEEFIQAPIESGGVDLPLTSAYRCLRCYQTFVVDLQVEPAKLAEVGSTKLDVVRPRVTPDNVDSVLQEASALSVHDLSQITRPGGSTIHDDSSETADCPHRSTRCLRCGRVFVSPPQRSEKA